MITIPVRVCGDIWRNPTYVKQKLNNAGPTDSIELEFFYEGPCIKRIGLLDILKQCKTQDITLVNWPNLSGPIPYSIRYPNPYLSRQISHFFTQATNYWVEQNDSPVQDAFTFGLFLGRDTVARNSILYDIAHEFAEQFLLSKLTSTDIVDPWRSLVGTQAIDFELEDSWGDGRDIIKWLATQPIKSLDSRELCDQYNLGHQIVFDSLLDHYDHFHIELVCETYTLGDTFFPTEKTVRPIMAAKPVLVYGPRYFLKNLRKLGFETYSSCWDESYDELEGWARWQAMKKQIPNIRPSEKSQAIADQNRKHLAKLIDEQLTFELASGIM
jgi:hypothetical protein